ncbi:ribokinase [Lederbergia ruris]|uniref:Ribokinase n=1 Tax=Lederbergia ruris TaxID=217495 RepID=A0ABQ4KGJ9_9BACI|nr:ribokinase [Lederbergia ruris]GIN57090.1 ribokinase [Lederbergia ruris]
MKYDIAVVGSINMDVIVETPNYPEYGETLFCDSITMKPGGKGANQAVSVAKLGKKTCLIGAVGNDSAGKQLIQNLDSKNVDTTHIIRSEEAGTGTFVAMIDSTGENTMVGAKGANDSLTTEDMKKIFEQIEAKILLIQMETSQDSIIAAMKAAKERNMYVILDPAPAEGIFDEAFKYADLITPNKQETKRITGIEVTDEASALEAAKKLSGLGIKDVIVKMGEHGSLVYQNGQATVVDAIKVKAVDTVGAGDCFAGALASSYLDTNDLVESAKFASVAAGIKVARHGGQEAIPTLKEVQEYVGK